MMSQFLIAMIFALTANIVSHFISLPFSPFLIGAVWGIAMWETIAWVGRIEARRREG